MGANGRVRVEREISERRGNRAGVETDNLESLDVIPYFANVE